MMVALTFLAALLPALLLLTYFVKKDRFPEPTHLLVKTFLFGLLITVPIVVLELALIGVITPLSGSWWAPFLNAFLVAGFIEELFKFLVLHLYCARKSDFDEPMDAVVYSVVVSLGFACLENVLYVMSGGMLVAALRAVTAVPVHASLGALMGYYYAKQRFGSPGRARLWSKALWVPVLVHGLYDLFPFILSSGLFEAEARPLLVLALVVASLFLMGWLFMRARTIALELRSQQF